MAEISVAEAGYDGQDRLRSQRQGRARPNVTIADRSKLFASRLVARRGKRGAGQPQESKFGVTVRDITPDMADRYQLPNNKGVIVQDVKPDGFGDTVGLSRGDVILEINKQPVNNEDDFRRVQSR